MVGVGGLMSFVLWAGAVQSSLGWAGWAIAHTTLGSFLRPCMNTWFLRRNMFFYSWFYSSGVVMGWGGNPFEFGSSKKRTESEKDNLFILPDLKTLTTAVCYIRFTFIVIFGSPLPPPLESTSFMDGPWWLWRSGWVLYFDYHPVDHLEVWPIAKQSKIRMGWLGKTPTIILKTEKQNEFQFQKENLSQVLAKITEIFKRISWSNIDNKIFKSGSNSESYELHIFLHFLTEFVLY